MKINQAHRTLEELLSASDRKSEKKIYQQLLGALSNLKGRDLTMEQLQSVEAAIDRLRLHETDGMNTRELRSRSNQFMKHVRKMLSLIPEGHYMVLGLAFGVAFGGVISAVFQGFSGAPQSGTGLGIGIGLIAGYIIGSYLDVEARKQNRVLTTQTR
jgi:hypothetical protein